MNGPPDWLMWAFVASSATAMVFLACTILSPLIDRLDRKDRP